MICILLLFVILLNILLWMTEMRGSQIQVDEFWINKFFYVDECMNVCNIFLFL